MECQDTNNDVSEQKREICFSVAERRNMDKRREVI